MSTPIRRPVRHARELPPRRSVRIPGRRGGGAGDSYIGPVLLRVKSLDALGRISDATVCWDDTVVELESGDEFVTAFVAACAANPPKARA